MGKNREALDQLTGERRARVEAAIAEEVARRRRVMIWAAGIFAAIAVVMVVMFSLADQGRTPPADAVAAVARVDRAPDGSCLIGERGSHCYGLEFTVFADEATPYAARLDVVVPGRWASRVQPGSFIRVFIDRHDSSKIFLDEAAFAEPAPSAPEEALR